jgi:hypothetical protein
MKKTSSFLTGFLAMLVAAGLLSSAGTAQAALISINIGSFGIGGINGGVPNDSALQFNDFPIPGNELLLYNNLDSRFRFTGLEGRAGLAFATGGFVTPVKFSLNDSIDSGSTYSSGNYYDSGFRYDTTVSPDFGSGSYMGFKTSQGNYGWLEVTWTASSNQFQILSGAYESTPNVAILAGAGPGPAPVPEPGTWAAAALLAGGAAFMRWRKRAKVA